MAGGFNFNGLLLTRENKVSIFTVYNASYVGLLAVPARHRDDAAGYEAQLLSDNDGIPD